MLIICSECGKEFSDKAAACPNCGCPVEEAVKIRYERQIVQESKNTYTEVEEKGSVASFVALVTAIASLFLPLGPSALFATISIIAGVFSVLSKEEKRHLGVIGVIIAFIAIPIKAVSFDYDTSTQSNEIVQEEFSAEEEIENDAVVSENLVIEEENAVATKKEIIYPDEIDAENNNCRVRYLKSEIIESQYDGDCLVVWYEFTNNDEEEHAYIYTFRTTAYQNGIELDAPLFHINEDSKNSGYEIKPGVTITLCESYILRDMSDVTLDIEPWVNVFSKKLGSMTIELN